MFTQFTRNAVIAAQRRTFAAASGSLKHPKDKPFKEIWLAERGAYPVIGIMGFATLFCAFCCVRNLTSHPDVRIVPSKRGSIVRTWED